MLPVTITPTSINILLGGRMRTIGKTHANFNAVLEKIKQYQAFKPGSALASEALSQLKDLIDIPSFIARVTEGKVQISSDKVYYDGVEAHGVIAQRLLTMLNEGFDPKPLARFMNNLMANPDVEAIKDLYEWLEVAKLPITDDGHFLAFKSVKRDYTSHHDSKTDNSIGTRPTLPREHCDPSRYNECSSGLHFAAFDYIKGSYSGSSSRIVIVKINPADVVAIPTDYNRQKGRAWTYEVVDEVPEEECPGYFKKSVSEDYPELSEEDRAEVAVTVEPVEELVEEPVEELIKTDEEEYPLPPTDQNPDFPKYVQTMVDPTASRAARNDALINAFSWSQTEQGYDFWSEAYDKMRDVGAFPAEAFKVLSSWNQKVNAVEAPVDTEPHFEHNGKKIPCEKVAKAVEKHGQRGASRLLGVARTTLQGWLKRLAD